MSSNQLRAQVLGAYKSLSRASRQLFAGDSYAIQQSKQQLRQQIFANKNETNVEKINNGINDMKDVEALIRHNFVQARLNERGNYAVNLSAQHVQTMDKDEHIEPVDQAYSGRDVTVERVSGCKSSKKTA